MVITRHITLVVKRITELTSNELRRLAVIAAPYYEDASSLLKRDLAHCTHIYLSLVDGDIQAFFMVGWEELTINGDKRTSVYLGLSCADKDYRSAKVTSVAYIWATLDMASWEQSHGDQLLIWVTTATPVVLKVVPKFWDLIQPDLTRECGEQDILISEAIKDRYFTNRLLSDSPFVLKGVATGTRYSSEEKAYLDEVAHKINLPIFEMLGVDERQGDRLLMLMNAPRAEKVERLKQELAEILGVVAA